MKYGSLILKKEDLTLLKDILANAYQRDEVSTKCFQKLNQEMLLAQNPTNNHCPKDVITFGSIVDIQTPYGLMKGYQLVKPKDNDPANKKISVLTPMGSALIGYAEGDEVIWSFPSGEQKIKIVKVKNPS
ncbi:MAG: GreA/GreB family elongation factor [Bacteroidetes bacterium]|nr:GreA/GreB family elongation factor [Bacteroidota bacterium]